MARFSKSDIRRHRELLCQWHIPNQMSGYVDDLMNRLGSVDLFKQAGLDFIRNAWIAGKFGTARNAKAVRLISSEWPDFELCMDTEEIIEKFEATEADLPNRRRGDEYQIAAEKVAQGQLPIEGDSVEDWIARADMVPSVLMDACQRKMKKRYNVREHLVIYLNIEEYGIRRQEIERCFPDSTACARAAFRTIWILWKSKAYLIWQNDQNIN